MKSLQREEPGEARLLCADIEVSGSGKAENDANLLGVGTTSCLLVSLSIKESAVGVSLGTSNEVRIKRYVLVLHFYINCL